MSFHNGLFRQWNFDNWNKKLHLLRNIPVFEKTYRYHIQTFQKENNINSLTFANESEICKAINELSETNSVIPSWCLFNFRISRIQLVCNLIIFIQYDLNVQVIDSHCVMNLTMFHYVLSDESEN